MTKKEYKTKMRKKAIILIPLWFTGLFTIFVPWGYLDWFMALPLTIAGFILLKSAGSEMHEMAEKFKTLED